MKKIKEKIVDRNNILVLLVLGIGYFAARGSTIAKYVETLLIAFFLCVAVYITYRMLSALYYIILKERKN